MSPVLERVSRPCPCCGGQHADPVFDNTMAPIGGLDMSYQVGRCPACGFLYASELPPGERYARYYGSLSKYDQVATPAAIPEVDRIRVRAVVEMCRTHLSAQAAVADLGCGVGHLLHGFGEAGWGELHGLDPAPGAPERAHSLFGLDGVRCGLLADAPTLLPLDHIDLVCLTGVLEHLWSLREDLAGLIRHLRPGTLILVEVPALERFVKAPFEPFGEFSLEHIQYFSAASLTRLFAGLGADCVESALLELPAGTTDSLLGLFRTGGSPAAAGEPVTDGALMADYLHQSSIRWDAALDRIAAASTPWILYGAGSHSARLLPALATRGLDAGIAGIVDGNANLHGQTLGRWTIAPPAILAEHPVTPVLISSFRAQNAIHAALDKRFPNPLTLPYPAGDTQ